MISNHISSLILLVITGIKHVTRHCYSAERAATLDPAPSNIVVSDDERLAIGLELPDVARKAFASSTNLQRKDIEDEQQGAKPLTVKFEFDHNEDLYVMFPNNQI